MVLIYVYLSIPLTILENLNFNPQIQKWGCSDLIQCHIVFTLGLFRSDIVPSDQVVLKLNAYQCEIQLISTENVCCCCDLDWGQTDPVHLCWLVLKLMFVPSRQKSSRPNLCHVQSLKCESFLWSWWPWKQGQGQTYNMQLKVLLLCIFDININSLLIYKHLSIALVKWEKLNFNQ